ncbi:hypothetical protein IW261DRAFT_1147814 [Armillaria novae-zelandiae]|uniref:Uncharacterized protein n=1 Tax=Armillaria novae-zelandiae TaxID=153914 RepID=A0AA39PCH9_9AGAR|nr:hypothetical protein IW261DRAFT_1147814 [Armillaria novae-zelandiae]
MKHAQCLRCRALSRSAQFWSSYSGYLREIPQLCFSFRIWHDIDATRDNIYNNITREKIALLRYFSQRQHTEQAHMSAWESHLSNITTLIQALSNNMGADVQYYRSFNDQHRLGKNTRSIPGCGPKARDPNRKYHQSLISTNRYCFCRHVWTSHWFTR